MKKEYESTDPRLRKKLPRVSFFYDWLKDTKLIHPGERSVGERGECFIQTDDPKEQPSILNIEQYTLLPYKNTKLNYDESKLFLQIIASCLQIDPAKRPTAESLLKTYSFNQPSQSSDKLEMYLKVLNTDIFTSKFIYPIFQHLD